MPREHVHEGSSIVAKYKMDSIALQFSETGTGLDVTPKASNKFRT